LSSLLPEQEHKIKKSLARKATRKTNRHDDEVFKPCEIVAGIPVSTQGDQAWVHADPQVKHCGHVLTQNHAMPSYQ